uniref:ODF3A protein n=1 Tax=Calidris pygmaea TaxID=425635 RepID=A0A8C3K1X4_9CHAR
PGSWVGTWRPHRPRGPVLAQFTSPGPKYTILGTTGHLAHNPTKTKAPAYSIPQGKLPPISSCSPGPRYFVPPEINRNGKYVSPAQHICGLPKIKTEITPGPSEYPADAGKEHSSCLAPHGAHPSAPSPPGPGAYTLPRLIGPNTTYTTASPCYSMVGKKKRGGFTEDLAKTPGPAAFPKVEVDVFKTRSPSYTAASKAGAGGDRTVKPGPADYPGQREPRGHICALPRLLH